MARSRTAAWIVAWLVLASGWVVITSLPGSASCAAPTVSVTPRTASAGDRLVVRGDYWITTCNDTSGGCERAPRDPYLDISVTILPANGMGASVILGPVDAIDDEFTFRLVTKVPDLPPGTYFVIARAAHPVHEADRPAVLNIT